LQFKGDQGIYFLLVVSSRRPAPNQRGKQMPTIRLSRTLVACAASLIVAAYALSSPAAAAECKTLQSVQQSAIPANNTAAGGHLTGHISGATPPPDWNYTNKTLYTSSSEYTGAWNNYVKLKQDNPLQCSVNAANQAVSVQKLLNKPVIGAISCKNATCTTSNKTQMKNITFAFIYNTPTKQWILNTSYPSD
jgi:hypothetical protein